MLRYANLYKNKHISTYNIEQEKNEINKSGLLIIVWCL